MLKSYRQPLEKGASVVAVAKCAATAGRSINETSVALFSPLPTGRSLGVSIRRVESIHMLRFSKATYALVVRRSGAGAAHAGLRNPFTHLRPRPFAFAHHHTTPPTWSHRAARTCACARAGTYFDSCVCVVPSPCRPSAVGTVETVDYSYSKATVCSAHQSSTRDSVEMRPGTLFVARPLFRVAIILAIKRQ